MTDEILFTKIQDAVIDWDEPFDANDIVWWNVIGLLEPNPAERVRRNSVISEFGGQAWYDFSGLKKP